MWYDSPALWYESTPITPRTPICNHTQPHVEPLTLSRGGFVLSRSSIGGRDLSRFWDNEEVEAEEAAGDADEEKPGCEFGRYE